MWITISITLLVCSNVFMTFAWYGHLKWGHAKPLWMVILISWGIALFEYCLMVPANRYGKELAGLATADLKIIQEAITLVVFIAFSFLYLKESLRWNHYVGMGLILAAVVFIFVFDGKDKPADVPANPMINQDIR